MKRIICVLISIIVALQVAGCQKKSVGEIPNATQFYYMRQEIEYHNEKGFITSEKRDVKQSANDLTKLINLYLRGPDDAELASPFPENTVVHSITHVNSIFSITLSNEFSQLHGYELSVACACLTLTLQQFVDANLIQISAKDADLDGNKHISMNSDSLVLFDVVADAG